MVPKGGHFVIGAIFLSIGTSAFTGSRSTPTCPRRMLLPPPVQSGATSTASMIRHDEGQKYTNSYYAGYLGDGASCRAWSPTFRSRNYRSTALLATPRVSDEEMAQRKEQLRGLLCATEAEIDKLLDKNPGILNRHNVVESHGPKIAMLQERLGIDQKAAGKLCLGPRGVLSSSLETLEANMHWLQENLNLDKKQLQKIMKRVPVTLTFSIEDNLEPTLENIQTSLALSDKELTKMIVKQPELLTYNFSTEKLTARTSFLESLLSIEENDIATLRKAIVKSPGILHWSEERMVEVPLWISERLGMSNARIAQMCRNFPDLLLSKTTTLKEKADWVQSAMSLSDGELGKIFGQLPALFGCSPKKNLEPKLRYLRKRLDLDDEQLKELLLKVPNLFSLSEDIIEEKLQFYSELVGESEAKRIVMKSTNLLKTSLKTRLRPRLSEVQKAGTKVVWSEQLIQRLARRTPEQWERYGLGDAPRGGAARSRKK